MVERKNEKKKKKRNGSTKDKTQKIQFQYYRAK